MIKDILCAIRVNGIAMGYDPLPIVSSSTKIDRKRRKIQRQNRRKGRTTK